MLRAHSATNFLFPDKIWAVWSKTGRNETGKKLALEEFNVWQSANEIKKSSHSAGEAFRIFRVNRKKQSMQLYQQMRRLEKTFSSAHIMQTHIYIIWFVVANCMLNVTFSFEYFQCKWPWVLTGLSFSPWPLRPPLLENTYKPIAKFARTASQKLSSELHSAILHVYAIRTGLLARKQTMRHAAPRDICTYSYTHMPFSVFAFGVRVIHNWYTHWLDLSGNARPKSERSKNDSSHYLRCSRSQTYWLKK